MKPRICWIALALTLVVPALGADRVSLRHQARSLQPGEVVLLSLEAEQPLSRAEVAAFDRTFPFYREGESGVWKSLLGIDLNLEPGSYTARVRVWDLEGNEHRHDYPLKVAPKEFPVRRLTVDEKFVNPPADQLERIRRESRKVSAIFARVTPQRYWEGPFLRPVPGPASSSFGKRSILNGRRRSPHSGTDFDGETGDPVQAPNAGRVVLAEELYYSGNTVILDHGQGMYSYFAHLSEIDVEVGAQVARSEVVGKVGATGRVTGPHLHWTLRLVRTRVDPLALMTVLSDE